MLGVLNNSVHGTHYNDALSEMDTESTVTTSTTHSNITRSTNTNSSIFPGTASYCSSVSGQQNEPAYHSKVRDTSAQLTAEMERLNLLQKYNGINVDRFRRIIAEHGREHVVMGRNNHVTMKPKLIKPVRAGKFAKWFDTIGPNDIITDDIKMSRGVLRKDRFQNPGALDTYLGLAEFMAMARKERYHGRGAQVEKLDKEKQYRVKRVRNKLKHWNAMHQQLRDAIKSVERSNYTLVEKVQHVNSICSIYIQRAERAIECFFEEPASHFMLDLMLALQEKIKNARTILYEYQCLVQTESAIV